MPQSDFIDRKLRCRLTVAHFNKGHLKSSFIKHECSVQIAKPLIIKRFCNMKWDYSDFTCNILILNIAVRLLNDKDAL